MITLRCTSEPEAESYLFSIERDDGGKDAVVHITAVEKSGMETLREGQKVSFELETGRDGKISAANLKAL
jgi:CspA family cold shock protein